MGTNVFYEHNRVISEVTLTEEGLFHKDQLPDDISGAELDVEVVHEVQLSDREGNLLILHFDLDKAMNEDRDVTDYDGKTRSFSSSSDNTMPTNLFTGTIKSLGDRVRLAFGFPAGDE